ncbi:hypothetical protein GCM10027421_28360 [Microbacterium shaanxiense]
MQQTLLDACAGFVWLALGAIVGGRKSEADLRNLSNVGAALSVICKIKAAWLVRLRSLISLFEIPTKETAHNVAACHSRVLP